MPKSRKNEKRAAKPAKGKWWVLRASTRHPLHAEEEQLKLRIGELEDLIVGAEAKDVRRRISGVLPDDRGDEPSKSGGVVLRHDERKALQAARIRGWILMGLLGTGVVAASAWLLYRVLLLS